MTEQHEPQLLRALQALHLVAANDVGGSVAWDFLVEEWATLTYEHGWRCAHFVVYAVIECKGMVAHICMPLAKHSSEDTAAQRHTVRVPPGSAHWRQCVAAQRDAHAGEPASALKTRANARSEDVLWARRRRPGSATGLCSYHVRA